MGETSWFEGLEHQLKHPDKSNFKGKAQNGFYKHWNKLKKIAHQTKPLVIFDEIERLLDFPGELDPHILSFLESFVCNPENGCFILAGSEKIRYSQNKQFADLVAKGEPHVRVGHYNEAAVQSIFVKVQTFLKYEEEILQYLIALCDGHPRFLDTILEILISLRGGRLSGVRRVGTTEIEFIRNMVMDRMSDVLWALWKRLSSEEFVVVQLMSKRIPQPFNPFECSLPRFSRVSRTALC